MRLVRRFWLEIAIIIGVAVSLNFALTRYDTNVIMTRGDYSETKKFETDPLLVLNASVADTFCLMQNPCRFKASARITAFYPRNGVPKRAAGVAGLALPYLLLMSASYLSLDRLRGWWRTRVAIALTIISLLILLPLAVLIYNAFATSHVTLTTLENDDFTPLLLVALSTATGAQAMGISLFFRSKPNSA
jgi:hypothetical protein